jgi:hypothetical protein
MTQFNLKFVKDLGLQREVMEALPYAVVGGATEGSLSEQIATDSYKTLLNHVVPSGKQLKILFLRVWTTDTGGARFSIVQTNPTAAGATGSTEAYPVVGSVPEGVRDYPMLEAAGAEVLRGSLKDPVHVLEGSIEFRLLGYEAGPSSNRYGVAWWGVEKVGE